MYLSIDCTFGHYEIWVQICLKNMKKIQYELNKLLSVSWTIAESFEPEGASTVASNLPIELFASKSKDIGLLIWNLHEKRHNYANTWFIIKRWMSQFLYPFLHIKILFCLGRWQSRQATNDTSLAKSDATNDWILPEVDFRFSRSRCDYYRN